jgi:phosphonate transport system substrate-binding protein
MEHLEEQMTGTKKLRAVSYLAPNWFSFYEAILAYLGRLLGVETEFQQGECDPLEDPLLFLDQLDLAFICGLPLIRYCQVVSDQLQTLVAPVMLFARYRNRPIYFSDVIVNAASHLNVFEDLAGKIFCYNDPGSNSGYNLLHDRLIKCGHSRDFLSKAIQSGSHQRSIRLVTDGTADYATIDSIVLEQELRNFPELKEHLRVLEVLGPSPVPPIVVAQRLGISLIQEMQLALLEPDAELQKAMELVKVQRFAKVELEDYKILGQLFKAR